MQKKLLAIVALAVGAGAVGAAQSGLPTVDQVLDKYAAAAGGRAAFERLTSRVVTGTVEIPDFGVTGSIRITEKAPDKALSVVELVGMGTVREATDGVTAWEDNPQQGLREKTGAELAEAKRGASFNQEIRLKAIYPSLTVSRREPVNNRVAIVLTATPPDGMPVHFYFDEGTGLMVKQVASRQTPQGPIDFEIFMDDYRDIDGVKQPFLIRQVTSMFTAVIRITEIRHNVAIDDAIFRKPGE